MDKQNEFSFTTARSLGNDAPANLPRSQGCWLLLKMNTIRQVLAFAWPFLNRYRGRLILGLLLGLAYSCSMPVLFEVQRPFLSEWNLNP